MKQPLIIKTRTNEVEHCTKTLISFQLEAMALSELNRLTYLWASIPSVQEGFILRVTNS